MVCISRKRTVAIGLGLTLCGTAVAAVVPLSASGSLSGPANVDIVNFTASRGDIVNFTVSGAGAGKNKLIVKIQQQTITGMWRTRVKRVLVMPGASTTGSFRVRNFLPSTTERLRYHLSCKPFSPPILWNLSHS